MNLATAHTRAQVGLAAPPVRVEVCCGPGLPQFAMVGLAEAAVRESRDRVRAAILNSGLEFPAGDCRNDERVQITDEQIGYMVGQFDTVMYPKEGEAFSFPPTNHLASGAFQSSTFFHFLRQVSSEASRAQNFLG